MEFEDSSDEEGFEQSYPLLYTIKYEQDSQTILNGLMDQKQNLKTMIMMPPEKFIKKYGVPNNPRLSEYEEGGP